MYSYGKGYRLLTAVALLTACEIARRPGTGVDNPVTQVVVYPHSDARSSTALPVSRLRPALRVGVEQDMYIDHTYRQRALSVSHLLEDYV